MKMGSARVLLLLVAGSSSYLMRRQPRRLPVSYSTTTPTTMTPPSAVERTGSPGASDDEKVEIGIRGFEASASSVMRGNNPRGSKHRQRARKKNEFERARDDEIFAKLRDEASCLEHSALLGPAMRQQILDATDLADAIAEVISSRLARASSGIMLPRKELKRACYGALRDDPRPGADIVAILERDPAAISYLQVVMFLKGFHSVQAQRVSGRFWARGSMSSRHVALAIQNRVSELWAVDVHPAAWLGGGLLMDHATGIVVGETAVVGSNCTILHSVTLGGTGKERGDRHPKVGDRVVLGAGATVLGNIVLADGATVGSQAVVTKDVPDGMTVVGLNKILDPKATPTRISDVKLRTETWQYELGDDHSYMI